MHHSVHEPTHERETSAPVNGNGRHAAVSSPLVGKDARNQGERDALGDYYPPPAPIRWVGRILGILFVLCLILAGLVWWQILSGLQ